MERIQIFRINSESKQARMSDPRKLEEEEEEEENNFTSYTREYPEVSGLSGNEINNNKHSLRSNTNGYGGKTH
jgi:hypothetical protein